jgi:hypothetical protein
MPGILGYFLGCVLASAATLGAVLAVLIAVVWFIWTIVLH